MEECLCVFVWAPFERYSPNKKLHQKDEPQKESQFAPRNWKCLERKYPTSENEDFWHFGILIDLKMRMAKEAVRRNPVCRSLNQQERQSNTGTSACLQDEETDRRGVR